MLGCFFDYLILALLGSVPMAGPVPQTLQEVGERFLGVIFSSKLALDAALFHKINGYIDLFEAINALLKAIERDKDLRQAIDVALAKAGDMTVERIRTYPGYTALGRHRKINAFTMIPFKAPPEATHGTDFSRASIEQRIAAGHDEAIAQKIGEPKWVQP